MRFFYSTCLMFTIASLTLAMDTAKKKPDLVREAALASIRKGRKPTEPIPIPAAEDKKASSQTRTLPIRQRRSFESMTNALSLRSNRFNSPHSY